MSFVDKVVVITGAGAGIGAATAKAFAKDGAQLHLVDKNKDKLQIAVQECFKEGLLSTNADISIEDDVRRLIEATINKFGRIDILINNAGSAYQGSILDKKILKAFDETILNNLRATINVTMEAVPHLIASKGNVVNVSSIAGKSMPSASDMICHSVNKSALDTFTKAAALELAPHGVRVNGINPGIVATDFLKNNNMKGTWEDFMEDCPLGRYSEAEEIADMILFLASDKAKGITGSSYVIDNRYLLTH